MVWAHSNIEVSVTLSIRSAARDAPERVALVTADRTYTFAELEILAASAARRVERLAGAPSAARSRLRVAFSGRSDVATRATLYACWELGWAPILLHARLTERERAALLERCNPDVALEPELDSIRGESGAGWPEGRAVDPEAIAAVLHTSGTEGVPKGVLLSHRAFVASADGSARNIGWEEDDRWLLSLPRAHVGGLSVVSRTLLARRCAVAATFTIREPLAVCDVIERERVTLASFVPTMLHKLLQDDPGYAFPPRRRAMFLGGAATSPERLALARERGVPALTTYGLTEACSQVTTQRYGTAPGEGAGSGHPLHGVEVKIEDGAVFVRGLTMMTGYMSADGGVERPRTPADWHETGDLGAVDAQGGCTSSAAAPTDRHGRGERAPARGGARARGAPDVSGACVFGVPDAVWGRPWPPWWPSASPIARGGRSLALGSAEGARGAPGSAQATAGDGDRRRAPARTFGEARSASGGRGGARPPQPLS